MYSWRYVGGGFGQFVFYTHPPSNFVTPTFSCIRLWQAVFSPWFIEHAYQDAFKRKTLCLPSPRLQKGIFPFSILEETRTRSWTTGFNHRFTWSLPSLLRSLSRQQNHHAWYASSQLFNGSDAQLGHWHMGSYCNISIFSSASSPITHCTCITWPTNVSECYASQFNVILKFWLSMTQKLEIRDPPCRPTCALPRFLLMYI